jgi:hypothetical protein
VAATMNPQAGEVQFCRIAFKMQCTQQTLHIWWHWRCSEAEIDYLAMQTEASLP